MKKLYAALASMLLIIFTYAQDDHAAINQKEEKSTSLTNADWQSDLKLLQHTVHKDYSFLFKNISAKEFDTRIEQLYQAIPGMQDHEILAGFARIVAAFKYGHTDIDWRQSPVKYHVTPFNFYWFSDGVYVEGTDKKYAALAGAKLTKVEGMPVMEALEKIKPLVPAENDQYFKAYGLDFLTMPEALHAQRISQTLKNSVTYTFEKDGTTMEQTIAATDAYRFPRKYGFVEPGKNWVSVRNHNSTPPYLKNLERIYYFEYFPEDKTLYVRHSQILDDSTENIPAFYKRVFDFIDKNEVEKMVLDLRLNGGGNNYKNKPIVTGIIESEKINQPGKLFVIIGKRTFSACQNLVNELSNYTNALFVGEPTSENINFYGDNRRIELTKSKLPVYLSFAWWQDKPQWENAAWQAPHLAVEMSFEEYKTNKDPVLDACLQFADKDFVLDPINYLKDLFRAGKLDLVETAAKKMVADPVYKFVEFESKINRSGYELINDNQLASALFVFELNTKLFPLSANAWDSLAEANWISKNKEKAIEYYNKAITLDPDGVTGANAREMLRKISDAGN